MCGILGQLGKTSSDQLGLPNLLKHRGPDSYGKWKESATDLHHFRLSIIDLSDAANQPMHSHDGRWVMIFNGEVYNYREIAEELGIQTQTTGDTEVILEAFAKEGKAALSRFNGMFAAAIWDREKSELHLFRDRLGIKPLYFWHEAEQLAFASELKALLSLVPEEAQTLNPKALTSFLHLGYAGKGQSFFQGIRQLKPGEYACFKGQTLQVESYWSSESVSNVEGRSEDSLIDRLEQLARESVSYRMIADVPLGTFLSGGIDSSLVTALAQDQSSKPVRTFSIGFESKKYNEAHYAQKVADALKTNHTPFTVSLDQARDLLDTVVGAYDEPYGDSSSIPTMIVSELARQHVTVALSGDGGDETHLGYGAYTWAKRLSQPVLAAVGKPAAAVAERFGGSRYQRASKMFKAPNEGLRAAHILSQEQYAFSLDEIDDLLLQPAPEARAQFIWPQTGDPIDRQSRFDLNSYLPDDLLVKVDRASMFHSLEVRVPLLDHRLVEFALSIPSELRMKGGEHKYLLKRVLYRYLDPELFNRPKWGFSVPVEFWIQNDWADLINDYLSEDAIRRTGLLNPKAVLSLRKRFASGESYLYKRIWLLFVLQKWLIDFRSK